MSILLGPYPLELADVLGSTRRALDRWQANPEGPTRSKKGGRVPGLWLLVQDGALYGVWLTFGATWLDRGDPGEAKDPPYADEVFTAFTEAVWWSRLKVAPVTREQAALTWTPLLVLEWPSPLAARSGLRIPGEPVSEKVQSQEAEEDVVEAGQWLDEAILLEQAEEAATTMVAELRDAGRSDLSPQRSAICVIRGSLSTRSGRHRGTFELMPLAAGVEPLSTSRWVELARLKLDEPAATDVGRLRAPISLPLGGVGFPMVGWLDRRLRLCPSLPDDILTGTIHERDVGGLLYRRFMEALKVGIGLLAAVVLFALLVWKISEPRSISFLPPVAPDPPPALSLCSVDNARFLRELRCQVAAMAVAVDPNAPVCGDHRRPGEQSVFVETATPDDVQPLWCGLRDRQLDQNWVPGTNVGWADMAAARACFNVLGYPDTYARAATGQNVQRPAVTAFFDERKLRIQSLVGLVEGLDEGCVEAGRRAKRQVEGAILATHVGDGSAAPRAEGSPGKVSEAGLLREHVGAVAGRSLGFVERGCLLHGLHRGVAEPVHYDDLCGDAVRPAPSNAAWTALGPSTRQGRGGVGLKVATSGVPPVSTAGEGAASADEAVSRIPTVLDRYVATRFFTGANQTVEALEKAILKADSPWRCHVQLSGPRALADREQWGMAPPMWDIAVPGARTYAGDRPGLVRNQLKFDAIVRWLKGRGDGGVCWSAVLQRVGDYVPVHPLLPERANSAWPSEQQQLCGQICAASYRVEEPQRRADWITPGSDLAMCMDSALDPPTSTEGLDRLRISWNDDRDGLWVEPSSADICAFNLLAQGWFRDRGAVLPVDGVEPYSWAGETQPGSLIAGGLSDGDLGAQAALAMESYGGERSAATCAYVAAQCISSTVLDAIGESPARPFNWASNFRQRVAVLAQSSGPAGGGQSVTWTPWCRLVKQYLPRDDQTADGRIDFPCAEAVGQTVQAGASLIEVLAAGDSSGVEEPPL
jgi:hypothetical protein